MSIEETLETLVRAGLGSLTGGGAEIFAEPTRSEICKGKQSAEDWLGVHRIAHNMGLSSTCTMLYGHIETDADRVDHILQYGLDNNIPLDELKDIVDSIPNTTQKKNFQATKLLK